MSIIPRRALPLFALLLAAPAIAEDDSRALLGQPVLALAQYQGVAGVLATATGGARGAVSRRLREPGPGLALLGDRYVYGWGCGAEGCAAGGIFLAQDFVQGRIYLLLLEDGRTRLAVPPSTAGWPPALAEAMRGFDTIRAAQIAAPD
ncbi:hypothetical protein [Plastoroseomonas arctica]|uniref:Uncharacterized protein n=1 Tax=Plastoroseomonas arctica TaxID=1509237 RepID=A0AAF1KQ28_9PROT|nr:hypothetical protein [Plastoroseomonas arctica]MBR0656938.1 hypothetical protein [Plastoroseomonas arctica]